MLLSVFFFGLGLIIGSFLNVLILRYGTGKTLGGRSACASCNHTLSALDLVPVISWVVSFGRCRYCGSKVSIQYPIVEGVTGGLFLVLGVSALSLPELLFALPLAALLVAIAVYDIRHTIIPDAWAYLSGGLAFLFALVMYGIASVPFILFGGLSAAFPLFFLWLVSGGRWMGFGDVKLALPLGFVLGPWAGFVGTFFAFIIGAVIGVSLLAYSSERTRRILSFVTPTARSRAHRARFTMKSEVPFGPFLIASFFLLWLSHLYHISLPLLP